MESGSTGNDESGEVSQFSFGHPFFFFFLLFSLFGPSSFLLPPSILSPSFPGRLLCDLLRVFCGAGVLLFTIVWSFFRFVLFLLLLLHLHLPSHSAHLYPSNLSSEPMYVFLAYRHTLKTGDACRALVRSGVSTNTSNPAPAPTSACRSCSRKHHKNRLRREKMVETIATYQLHSTLTLNPNTHNHRRPPLCTLLSFSVFFPFSFFFFLLFLIEIFPHLSQFLRCTISVLLV